MGASTDEKSQNFTVESISAFKALIQVTNDDKQGASGSQYASGVELLSDVQQVEKKRFELEMQALEVDASVCNIYNMKLADQTANAYLSSLACLQKRAEAITDAATHIFRKFFCIIVGADVGQAFARFQSRP